MVFQVALSVPIAQMNSVAVSIGNVSQINLCAKMGNVLLDFGDVMVKTIVGIIQMRKAVAKRQLADLAGMKFIVIRCAEITIFQLFSSETGPVNSNAEVAIVYQSLSIVIKPMIVPMELMKLDVVSTIILLNLISTLQANNYF